MPIEWRPEGRQLHLHNPAISHVMAVLETGTLAHLHFGAPLAAGTDYRHLVRRAFVAQQNQVLDPVGTEVPTSGRGDLRAPALAVRHADGSAILDLVYREHRLLPGKPALPGLPSTYVEDDAEADSVEIVLEDTPSGLVVRLLLTIYRDRPLIVRSLRIMNEGQQAVELTTAMSASLDLPDADWHLAQLDRRLGPRVPRHGGPARPRTTGPGQPAWDLEPLPEPLPAAAAPGHDGGQRGGHRHLAGLLGELPGRGRGGPLRHRSRAPRPGPGDVQLAAPARLVLPGAGGRAGLERVGRGRGVGDVPPALPGAPRARPLARSPAPGPAQQLGRRLLRLRRGPAGRDGRRCGGPGRRALRPR